MRGRSPPPRGYLSCHQTTPRDTRACRCCPASGSPTRRRSSRAARCVALVRLPRPVSASCTASISASFTARLSPFRHVHGCTRGSSSLRAPPGPEGLRRGMRPAASQGPGDDVGGGAAAGQGGGAAACAGSDRKRLQGRVRESEQRQSQPALLGSDQEARQADQPRLCAPARRRTQVTPRFSPPDARAP